MSWNEHLAEYRKANPEKTLKQCMIEAKGTYKRNEKPTEGGVRATLTSSNSKEKKEKVNLVVADPPHTSSGETKSSVARTLPVEEVKVRKPRTKKEDKDKTSN